MTWKNTAALLVSQLNDGNESLFNELCDAVWFKGTLNQKARLDLALALKNIFFSVSDVRVKIKLLKLIGWADSASASNIALDDLEKVAGSAVRYSHYLYESILIIARERSDLFSEINLGSLEIRRNLRLAFAIIKNKPIVDGDCVEMNELSSDEYIDFMQDLLERKV